MSSSLERVERVGIVLVGVGAGMLETGVHKVVAKGALHTSSFAVRAVEYGDTDRVIRRGLSTLLSPTSLPAAGEAVLDFGCGLGLGVDGACLGLSSVEP